MLKEFFSRSATPVVAGALLLALVWAAVTLGPTAIERWF
jgi:hypothetical protein